MRVLDYALASDGGTRVIVMEIGDGGRMSIGLDGRMNSPYAGKQVFLGSSVDGPDTRMLPIGGHEEREVISLLEDWAEETQGFIRREALMETEPSSLAGQDLLDRMALQLLLDIRGRDAV